MMRLSNGNRSDDPLGRGSPAPGSPSPWRKRARKALDSWGGGAEFSVAVGLEDAYRDGIKRAAAFIEEKGQRELATMLRRLAEEAKSS